MHGSLISRSCYYTHVLHEQEINRDVDIDVGVEVASHVMYNNFANRRNIIGLRAQLKFLSVNTHRQGLWNKKNFPP